MDCMKRLGNAHIVPVVVIENAMDAVQTANALYQGGIDVMEITLRTEAALDAIRNVSANCPDVLVGAGTVLSLEKCKSGGFSRSQGIPYRGVSIPGLHLEGPYLAASQKGALGAESLKIPDPDEYNYYRDPCRLYLFKNGWYTGRVEKTPEKCLAAV